MTDAELLRWLAGIHDTVCDIEVADGRVHHRAIKMLEDLQAKVREVK